MPPQRWGPGRVIALVIAILLLLPGLGLVVGGGVLLWADGPGPHDDGYLYSASDDFSTSGYALTSEQHRPRHRRGLAAGLRGAGHRPRPR